MRIDVKYNQTPQRPLTFWEKYQVAELMSQWPALTVKVLFRRRVGLRRADPLPVFLMAAIPFTIGWLMRGQQSMTPLMWFGLAVAACGYWQYRNRWRELRRGVRWHTYSDGISPLAEFVLPALYGAIPWIVARLRRRPDVERQPPAATERSTPIGRLVSWLRSRMLHPDAPLFLTLDWWQSERRIYRYLDGAFISCIGLYLYTRADPYGFAQSVGPLGFWPFFAGACLSVDARMSHRHQTNAYFDLLDSQIDGEVMKGWSGAKAGARRAQRSPALTETCGLPTGIGEDIRARVEAINENARLKRLEARIAEREERARPGVTINAPDNLAPASAGRMPRKR
jgi:hypothetical protein